MATRTARTPPRCGIWRSPAHWHRRPDLARIVFTSVWGAAIVGQGQKALIRQVAVVAGTRWTVTEGSQCINGQDRTGTPADSKRTEPPAMSLNGSRIGSVFCVLAAVVVSESARAVAGAFGEAMRRWGLPDEVLTDNGTVFTGRRRARPGEVLFERICRENGITQRLTAPRSPTTTGQVERFHKRMRTVTAPRTHLRRHGGGTGGDRRLGREVQLPASPQSTRHGHSGTHPRRFRVTHTDCRVGLRRTWRG